MSENYNDAKWGGEQLKKLRLFQSFKNEELEKLYSLGEIQTKVSSTHILIEGEPSRGLYLLLKGKVSVYKTDSSNAQMLRLALLEPGAFFGEISLFDTAPRSATVVAESTCKLFYMDINKFEEFLDSGGDPLKVRFYQECAKEMANRFREQNLDYFVSQKLLWSHALRKDDPKAKPALEATKE